VIHVRVFYCDALVWRDIALPVRSSMQAHSRLADVEQGDFVVVVGLSGCGNRGCFAVSPALNSMP
jgi:ABC-type nitrate/sulfonate/bicarbonate transport system ATPase subunit